MNIYELLDEYSEFFEKRIKFQRKIMKINENNIDKLKTFLIDSQVFSSKNDCKFLLDTISSAFYARPKSFDLLIDIIDTFKDDIKKHFSSDKLFCEFFTLNITRLKLFQMGLIEMKTFTKIRNIDDETIIFFAPEIKNLIENHPEIVQGTNLENSKKQIMKYIIQVKEKNIQRPTTLVFSDEQISKIIENDSISEFQKIISQTNLSIDSKIKINNDVLYILPTTSPSLIEYSMFFNSINIFKFLMLNNAKIDDLNSPCFAIAGGSYTIIHILEEHNKINRTNAATFVSTAIRFHRIEIANYFADNFGVSFDFEDLVCSIRYNNYDAFVKSIPSLKLNPNERGDDQETALYTCVNFGRFEFLKFLSHIDEIDFNVKSIFVEWSPLHLAASYNQLEIVKYLCSMTSKEEIKKHKIYDDDEINKDQNETNKEQNESSKEQNETNKEQNESNKETNDSNKDQNESNKETNETNKDQNESNKEQNETNKDQNETNKNQNETNKNQNDSNKNQNETNKDQNDSNKNQNDSNKNQNDSNKNQNEAISKDQNEQIQKKESSRFIDVNVKSVNNLTPLHIAASNGFADIVSFLCSLKNVNVNARNLSGEVALHFAALGNLETMKVLCSRQDTDINVVNSDGETPLFFAIKSENVEMVKYLLSLPQIIKNISSRNGQTPSSLAQKRFLLYKTEKCLEIYNLLKE